MISTLFGCSAGTRTIAREGDAVSVQFTCRMPNNKVIMSTDESRDSSDRSPLYLPRKENGPLQLTAGKMVAGMGPRGDLDVELANGIARSIVGVSPGKEKRVALTAKPIPGPDGKPRLLPMARVRPRLKELRMSRTDYSGRFNKNPEVGAAVVFDPAIPGAVTEVTDTEVVVRFMANPGSEVPTPYGIGVIREDADAYEIVIDVHEGAVIRTGPLLGRIVSVNDRMFTIDYTQPFAGEELTCDLKVLGIEQPVSAENRRDAAAN
jgi:FKBP-type peptidyl-prolyl cis-trans isomerase 2